ncbi:MAG: transcription termination factor Rho [Candidatus Bipolaricaulota bacterium]|jgi:transcription termination factor Rho|nr:transcription termination factor Rho [Candidatus Bipolaricaulota bacterium]
MEVRELRAKKVDELEEYGERLGIADARQISRDDLMRLVMAELAKAKDLQFTDGILELHPDGYGFLRSDSCLPGKADVYISPSQIKRFSLRDGDLVSGPVRGPKNDERYFALLKADAVNTRDPEESRRRVQFQDLTPLHPDKHLKLEHDPSEISTRMIDLFCPIGKGQRGLIVSPPKAGKTTLLKKIAAGINANHPEIKLFVLLVDERPEEVTDFKRSIKNGEVVAATFDQEPKHHTRVAELVTDRAKRLVELGHDVVILMDSITRLARAYNLSIPASGKLLSGGMDPTALYKPKEFFGAARNIEEGGSLTIIATALVDTGSKLDQVVFEEFKGTGNMELVLNRDLQNRRIFPAIDIEQSGTRKEELLLGEKELKRVWILRKMIGELHDLQAAMEFIKVKMEGTRDNEQFLELMKGD